MLTRQEIYLQATNFERQSATKSVELAQCLKLRIEFDLWLFSVNKLSVFISKGLEQYDNEPGGIRYMNIYFIHESFVIELE